MKHGGTATNANDICRNFYCWILDMRNEEMFRVAISQNPCGWQMCYFDAALIRLRPVAAYGFRDIPEK
jgi:hypothetical protein